MECVCVCVCRHSDILYEEIRQITQFLNYSTKMSMLYYFTEIPVFALKCASQHIAVSQNKLFNLVFDWYFALGFSSSDVGHYGLKLADRWLTLVVLDGI